MTDMDMRKLGMLAVFVLLTVSMGVNVSAVEDYSINGSSENSVTVHFFMSETCPYCAKEEEFLEKIDDANSNVEVVKYDTGERENAELYGEMNRLVGSQSRGVPLTFIGMDDPILGFGGEESTGRKIMGRLENCLSEGCEDPAERLNISEDRNSPGTGTDDNGTDNSTGKKNSVDLPLFGEVSAENTPLIVLTAMVAFVDGFNPCSLWVLTFLLGIVVYSGSRKKTFAVGFSFLFVTSLFYGLFIFGLLNVFSYIGHLFWIRAGVALLAVVFGLVNIKDFFWYKKGISFTIPESYKPKIFRKSRKIMSHSDSLPAMVGGTVLLAAGITLVELPCTAGFPVVWTNILSRYSPNYGVFVGLLLMYMVIYLLDELAVFLTVVFTMRKTRFQEKHGRLLKLIGGMIMVALAGTLLLAPKLMESMMGTVYVFGGAVVASLLIYWYYSEEEGFEEGDSDE